MRPICWRRKIASLVWSRPRMSVPSTSTWPELGVSTPPRMCSSVDLPEPEGPTMATNSPFSTLKLTSSMALICVSPFPYTFERLCTLRISTLCLRDVASTLCELFEGLDEGRKTKDECMHSGFRLSSSVFRLVYSPLHPWIVRRVGVHGRAAVIDRFGAQFVVPGFVAVDLAQSVLGAVFG